LEELASATPFAARIHFAGWRPDVKEILRSSDLLVLPSRWEGMPNILLEGMASGLPVMSTLVEGVAEVLGPLAAHQSSRPGDLAEFVAKAAAILKDPSLARLLGEQNRQRVTEHFSLANMIRAYERLYESLL
jgi:glycosyltransferase involved in cell wall biosynthesis